MTSYTISWRHVSPPNPGFTLIYDLASRSFKPARCAWTDQVTTCAYGLEAQGDELELTIARAVWGEPNDEGSYAESEPTLVADIQTVVPLNGCSSQNFTWPYNALVPQQLGNNPAPDFHVSCYERASIYYYYVIQNPSTRTPDIYVFIHYRGANPSHAELSQSLANDLARAICWKESTWRQFDSAGRPLFNKNSNGTTDWGCMQINQASPSQIWDWRDNVQQGLNLLGQKRQTATTYLKQHGQPSDDMLLRETIQLYNGGHYYKWDAAKKKWIAAPPDGPSGYVAGILNLIKTKPWGSLFDDFDPHSGMECEPSDSTKS